MKTIVLGVVMACVIANAATPQVKNVKAFQLYPWNKVCISYKMEGNIAASTGSGNTPFLVTNKDNA